MEHTQGLGCCQILEGVKFKRCKRSAGVLQVSMAALLFASKSLRKLRCCDCEGIDAQDGIEMQDKAWGKSVDGGVD